MPSVHATGRRGGRGSTPGRNQDGRSLIHFEVRDTGVGMSEEVLARLFSPFTQADASTTRRYGGTGLGLSISRRLIELMGGSIQSHQRAGRGLSFHFTLPCETLESVEIARSPQMSACTAGTCWS